MALISMPDGAYARFKQVRWGLTQPSQVNRSGWSGARRVVVVGAPVWRVQATVVPIARASKALPWRAFFAALQGRANTFRMPAYNPPGTLDAVAVNGSAAGASQLLVVAPGAPNHLIAKAGSHATIPLSNNSYQMVMLTADAFTDGAGQVVLNFKPALRRTSVPSSPVFMAFPFCEVAMMDDEAGWDGREGQQFDFSFSAEEAF